MFIYVFQFIALKGMASLVALLPMGLAYKLGDLIGWLALYSCRRERRIAEDNVASCPDFSDYNAKERRDIIKAAFCQLGRTIIEILILKQQNKKFSSSCVYDEEHVSRLRALADEKGLIFISGHFNNWEMLLSFSHLLKRNIIVAVQKIKNPYVNRWMYDLRCALGVDPVSKKGFTQKALMALKNKECVSLLIDQNAGEHGEQIAFLGRKASTFTTAAALSIKTGAPIVPIFDLRDNKGKHDLWVGDPLHPPADLKGDRKDAVLTLTRKSQKALEDQIKRYPAHWLWMHRRWKK